MNKWLLLLALFLGIGLTACSNDDKSLSGENPPKTVVEIGGETYETVLGSYCWKNTCVDTVAPPELLEGTDPVKVKPGEKITIVMDYNPKPNEVHMGQMVNGNDSKEVKMKNNQFTAPTEKGVYYYTYGVWWTDEKEKNVSHSDAFYSFAIEVE